MGRRFRGSTNTVTNIANYQEPPCFGLKPLHCTADKYLGNRARAGLRKNKLEGLSMKTQSIRMISWNVNGRVKCLSDQSEALRLRQPDMDCARSTALNYHSRRLKTQNDGN